MRPAFLVALALAAHLSAPSGASAAPRVARGVLTAPSQQPPAAVARSFVAADPDLAAGVPGPALAVHATRRLARGSLVALTQVHGGLPVLGARAVVRLDKRGRVRWAVSTLRSIGDLSTAPRLDAAAALAAAGAPGAPLASSRARLVIAALGEATPRLAWEVVLPPDRARLELWQVLVDATSGEEIARRNLVRRADQHLADVHPENPIATPDRVRVTLDDLPEEATTLVGPDIHARSCIDQRQCVDFGFGFTHWCEPAPSAGVGGDGSFLHLAPPADLLDPTDLYAELQSYYHTVKAYRFFRELVGDDGFQLDGAPVTAIANMQFPGDSCAGPGEAPVGSVLQPLDNAFFAPAGFGFVPGVDGASIAMGQGTIADFAYDGDVIYHELGHGLVYTLAPDLGYAQDHPHGWDPTPGGLVEGLPDYLSSALTGGALLGEFVGQGFDPETGVIRNLDNTRTCPESLAGETHFDGEIIGGALWQVRAALAAEDRRAMDEAVVTAIGAMGADTDFGAFQALVVAEMEVALGADAAASAAAVFEERGLVDCKDHVRHFGVGDVHEALFLINMVGNVAPAPVQFRVDFGAGAPSFALRADMYPGSDQSPVQLLIKEGDEPIQWTGGLPDATRVVDLPVSGTTLGQEIEGPFEGIVHMQLASPNASHGLLDISMTADIEGTPDAGPDDGQPDAGGGAGGDGDDEGGCGCRAGGGAAGAGTSALLLLAAIALAWRRRRA